MIVKLNIKEIQGRLNQVSLIVFPAAGENRDISRGTRLKMGDGELIIPCKFNPHVHLAANA